MVSFILGIIVGISFMVILLLIVAVLTIEKKHPEYLSDQELQDLAILNEERRWKRDNKRGANKRKS